MAYGGSSNELQRQGIPGRDLADRIDQAIADTDDHRFTEAMDLIRNHLRRAWHIEQSFIDRAPRPVAGDPSDLSRAACRFVDQVVTTLYSTWLRDRTHREEVSATGRDARCARSRSPRTTAPQKHMDDEGGGDASSLMDNSGGGGPLRKKSPTRLWKELPPECKSSEVRRLTPPWKKQNNPPFRPKEPREPSRSPPRTSPKPPPKPKPRPVPKCATDIPAPSTPTPEQPIPANDTMAPPGPMDYNDAISTWQALFEMNPNEGIAEEELPLLPQHVGDNIVETLVDKPLGDHNTMVDAFPSFMGRLQQDAARAMMRARVLRDRLSIPGSSSDKPHDRDTEHDKDEEDEDSIYMQTSLDFTAAQDPNAGPLLAKLQKAFNDLDPQTASSRAIRLASRLQEHDGFLAVERQAIEALLVSFSTDTPPAPQGEASILEFCWVGTWWRRLTGQPEPDADEVDANLQAYEDAVNMEAAARQAEEAQEAAAEQLYLRGLEEAVECHQEQVKAEANQQDDDAILRQAMGLAWEPPKKRLCLGVCVTDGQLTKAWDWELDGGAEVQIHIKATKTTSPGRWLRNGRPMRDHEVPHELREDVHRKPAVRKPPQVFDMNQPATKELYKRWKQGAVSNQSVVAASCPDMLAFFYDSTASNRSRPTLTKQRRSLECPAPRSTPRRSRRRARLHPLAPKLN